MGNPCRALWSNARDATVRQVWLRAPCAILEPSFPLQKEGQMDIHIYTPVAKINVRWWHVSLTFPPLPRPYRLETCIATVPTDFASVREESLRGPHYSLSVRVIISRLAHYIPSWKYLWALVSHTASETIFVASRRDCSAKNSFEVPVGKKPEATVGEIA